MATILTARTVVIAAASSLCMLLLLSSPYYDCEAFSIRLTHTATRSHQQQINNPAVVRMSDNDTGSDDTRSIKAVTVLGGTGFVGSRVCKLLADQEGIETVISLSKSGRIPAWLAKEEATDNKDKIVWTAIDLVTASDRDLDTAMGSPDAVISCLGTMGTNQRWKQYDCKKLHCNTYCN